MDIANPDTATNAIWAVPFEELDVVRLSTAFAFPILSGVRKKDIRALDTSYAAGITYQDLPQDQKDLTRRIFVKEKPLYFQGHGFHPAGCSSCREWYRGLGTNLKDMMKEVYYKENIFYFGDVSTLECMLEIVDEVKYMRRIGVDLKRTNNGVWPLLTLAKLLAHCEQLQEVEIGVDEAQLVRAMANSDEGYTGQLMRPQDIPFTMNKLVFRMRGVRELQWLSIPKVVFTAWIHTKDPDPYYKRCTGPIPGGVFETIVGPVIMRHGKARVTAEEVSMKRRAASDDGDYQAGSDIVSVQKRPRRSVRIQMKSIKTAEEQSAALPTNPLHQPPAHFRLLDLPGEIRNTIYYWAFFHDGPVHLSTRAPTSAYRLRYKHKTKDWPHSILALILANRQVYQEAVGLFFSQNTLVFYFPLQASMFLHSMSAHRTSYIKALELWHKPSHDQGGINLFDMTLSQISQLPKLESLDIILDGITALKLGSGPSFRLPREMAGEGSLKKLSRKGVKVTVRCTEAEAILFHALDENGNATPGHIPIQAMALGWRWGLQSARDMQSGVRALQNRISDAD